MIITRDNYEEFFMLYADDELTAAQRKEVDEFVMVNPDLKQELEMFLLFKLNPDTDLVFEDKEMLMKRDAGNLEIAADNYESFFVLYADNELTEKQKAGVEDFVYRHPQYQSAFELMQQVKLSADKDIIFEDKKALYRKEKDEKVIPFVWWRMAAAAAVLLLLGMFWLNQSSKKGDDIDVAVKNPAVTIPEQPTLHSKEGVIDSNSNKQPGVEVIAETGTKKGHPAEKNTAQSNTVAASVNSPEKGNNQTSNNPVETKNNSNAADGADNTSDKLKGVTVAAINETDEHVEINTGKTAAASKSVKNQELVYADSGESNGIKAEYAVATSEDENLEILNTSVNTKNSLRGFLRKASRAIARKTSGNEDDGTGKSILIGGFEIAVR